MAGRHSFAVLRSKMLPESRARAEAKSQQLREEMDLAELRRAHQLSQEELGQALKVGQASVAKLEKRTDMYVSTLRRMIEAMGGELEIVARFRDRSIRIKSFGELRKQKPAA